MVNGVEKSILINARVKAVKEIPLFAGATAAIRVGVTGTIKAFRANTKHPYGIAWEGNQMKGVIHFVRSDQIILI